MTGCQDAFTFLQVPRRLEQWGPGEGALPAVQAGCWWDVELGHADPAPSDTNSSSDRDTNTSHHRLSFLGPSG